MYYRFNGIFPTARLLKRHLVGILPLAQREIVPQVALEGLTFGVLLEGIQQLLVESHLILFALVGGLVLLLLAFEDVALLLGCFPVLGAPEVGVVDLFGHFNARDVDLGRRGQQVALVDASQRAAVDLKGSQTHECSASYREAPLTR